MLRTQPFKQETKPSRVHLYVAFGTGQFPDDMLRYDQATVIAGPLKRADIPGVDLPEHERAQYYVLTSKRPPTVERWNSFLWAVVTF